MHTLTKIRLFRLLLCFTYPFALIFLYPFVLAKKKSKTGLFFFFDRYIIGGAQRVYLDILSSVEDIPKQVYFTRRSQNDKLKQEFNAVPNTENRDIHYWCDNLLFRLFTVHFYSFYINRHSTAHMLGSNSTFFYDMLFFVRKHVRKSELLHSFAGEIYGMEFFGLGTHKYLNNRLVVDKASQKNMVAQHKTYGISHIADHKIVLIEPGVTVPEVSGKSNSLPLKVLYAGRGGVPKRVYLMSKIAENLLKRELPVEFHFAGSPEQELSPYVVSQATIHGELSDPNELYKIYLQCDVVLMTSSYEGFPMLIKEGMACGCIPIVTALPGIRSHIANEENGLLLFDTDNEESVVQQGIQCMERLTNDTRLRNTLAANAHNYAKTHFNKKDFLDAYRSFFLTPTKKGIS